MLLLFMCLVVVFVLLLICVLGERGIFVSAEGPGFRIRPGWAPKNLSWPDARFAERRAPMRDWIGQGLKGEGGGGGRHTTRQEPRVGGRSARGSSFFGLQAQDANQCTTPPGADDADRFVVSLLLLVFSFMYLSYLCFVQMMRILACESLGEKELSERAVRNGCRLLSFL